MIQQNCFQICIQSKILNSSAKLFFPCTKYYCRIVNESSWKFTWVQSRWPVIRNVNENRAYMVVYISLKMTTTGGIVACVTTSADGAFASTVRSNDVERW